MQEIDKNILAPADIQVGFYHLTRSSLEEALPALLGRTLDAGERAIVRCKDKAMVKRLDRALWACPQPLWLPHGSKTMGHAERQPIWLTDCDEQPNTGEFLFRINGAWDGEVTSFRRVFDLFDGHDEDSVAQARGRWKAMKQEGYRMAYWKQEPTGWKKAG